MTSQCCFTKLFVTYVRLKNIQSSWTSLFLCKSYANEISRKFVDVYVFPRSAIVLHASYNRRGSCNRMAEASTSMDETLAKTGGKKQIRKRQINYTREEQLRIAQFVKDHNIVLFGKAGYCGAKVEERKQKCWADLAQALRSDGGREREWRDVKKKWQDMKSRALKYPADAHLTGGGPPNPPDFVSLKVLEAVAPEVKEGLASSQNEAGLGEVTNSQELEEERTEQDTSVFPDEDVEEMQVVESLNTVAQLIACPSDTALIHNDLEDIKGQLNTIIDLLRKSSSAKEQ